MTTLRIVAGVALAAWVWLALVRGMYWRTNVRLPSAVDLNIKRWPSVAIIVPARDEVDVLPLTLATLVAQKYDGRAAVFLVDDNSTDGTGELAAERWPDVAVISPGEPPAGWAGKLWALRAGLAAADSEASEPTRIIGSGDASGCGDGRSAGNDSGSADATEPKIATDSRNASGLGNGSGSGDASESGDAREPKIANDSRDAGGLGNGSGSGDASESGDAREPKIAIGSADAAGSEDAGGLGNGSGSGDARKPKNADGIGEAFDYWLFTDADIAHAPDSLARLVAAAEVHQLDLVSQMARLRVRTGWERLVVPAFVYFFALLYPFRWSNTVGARTAAAAGGCSLVRRTALIRAGGLDAIRDAVIDDVALARAIKRAGGRTYLGLADHVDSIRPYPDLKSLWQMVARSAFAQLHRSLTLLAGTVVGLALVFWVPPVCLVIGAVVVDVPTLVLGAAGYALMTALYIPMLRYYRLPWPMAFALPFIATLYLGMTVDSAVQHFRGRGAAWKGRTYSGPSGSGHHGSVDHGSGHRGSDGRGSDGHGSDGRGSNSHGSAGHGES